MAMFTGLAMLNPPVDGVATAHETKAPADIVHFVTPLLPDVTMYALFPEIAIPLH
jgi:hypothetical protein